MRKTLLWLLPGAALCTAILLLTPRHHGSRPASLEQYEEEEENEGYDGPAAREAYEESLLVDPALGYVPGDRLVSAVEQLHELRKQPWRAANALSWQERGPISDLPGPYGNSRGNNSSTSGRVRAVLIDTLNDATGNTAFVGGVAGGLWKCTNFLSAIPNWTPLDDRFDNLAVSSIAQSPANPQVMYFSTGEPTTNSDAVIGAGVWKSTNGGASWTRLSSTLGFQKVFKVVCDAAGNVYLGNRSSGLAGSSTSGLYRSLDGGTTWTNISPSPLTATNAICSDIEISSTGRFHASFGFAGSRVQHVYTNSPATVTSGTWTSSAGIRPSLSSAYRFEMATAGNVLYGVTVASNNLDSVYKSIDGGATWTKQNDFAFPTGVLNGQGWYNLTLAINPDNTNEFIVGGLDAYRFTASGTASPTRMTYWVSSAPYVHADHHFLQWWKKGTESRIVIACDGGVFYSANGGTSFVDKNKNLAIKQFYSAAIHPAAGSNYMLAGAQDNGVHAFTSPGRGATTEVLGGDGCFVHINQLNPQIQVGTYVYNAFRFSTDGGSTWTRISLSTDGLFVNPFDFDDATNTIYSCNRTSTFPGQINRWVDAPNGGTNTTLSLTGLVRTTGGASGGTSAFKVSPYTPGRVFIGSSNGKVVRLDNGTTVTDGNVNASVTDISGTQINSGNISCVNTGSGDSVLVATISNYGLRHVYYSRNGGTTWTSIDGNLPDIPVRWAVIHPQDDNRIYLATEAGIFSTTSVNGASTVWTNDMNFPIVRTDMLKVRKSDNTIMAATHGRGVFTATLPTLTTAVSALDPDLSDTRLFPSQVQDAATLRVQSRKAMKIEWLVVDAAGRTVRRFTQSVAPGVNDVSVRFGNLPAGVYTLSGNTGKGRSVVRFVRK